MHDFKMSSPTLIPSPVCFIDGLARTGKRILCQLFPALDNMEHPHFFYLLEQILAMMEHNRISNDAARSLLTLQLNEFFCDYILSRNANFRPNELTSVFNARHPQKFFENLSKEDHPNNMREFSEGNTKYYSFQTHNLLTQFKTFKKLELPYKVISIFRDPIDTVWSWYERGWGTRFDSDSRAFTTLIQTNSNTKLPWWCLSIDDLYSESSPMDRCILMHNILLRRAIESAKNLNWNKGVLILKFEDLCQDPDIALRKISQFLGLSIGLNYSICFEKANIPRLLATQDKSHKLTKIQLNSTPQIFQHLVKLHNDYNTSFFGITDTRIKNLAQDNSESNNCR